MSMKIITTVLVLMLGTILVFAQNPIKRDTTWTASKDENQKDSIYYTCPMHADVKMDKPGNCPKCGMKLVKKEGNAVKTESVNNSTIKK